MTVPLGTPDGMYTLGLLADWQDVVTESDETDNALPYGGTFEVRTPPPPMPDLEVRDIAITPPATVSPGTVLDVVHTIEKTITFYEGEEEKEERHTFVGLKLVEWPDQNTFGLTLANLDRLLTEIQRERRKTMAA